MGLRSVAQPVGVLGLVAEQAGGRQLDEERQGALGVAHPARRQEHVERPAPAVADPVRPGVQPALCAPDRARAEPPFRRLAAVRCAFRCGLSSMSVLPSGPGWAKPQAIRAKAPSRDPRPKRLYSVLCGPETAGASRHLSPLRRTWIPLSTRRTSTLHPGRAPRAFGTVRPEPRSRRPRHRAARASQADEPPER